MLALPVLFLTSCNGGTIEKDSTNYPKDSSVARQESHGKITGDGFILFGGHKKSDADNNTGLTVNSFLWRATLDATSFMPLASTDPFGGVIVTDWHESADTPGERFKINVVILSKDLRADGVKVSVFRQVKDKSGQWHDAPVPDTMAHDFENIILTRARELRIQAG